jgi:hypothetical protein
MFVDVAKARRVLKATSIMITIMTTINTMITISLAAIICISGVDPPMPMLPV